MEASLKLAMGNEMSKNRTHSPSQSIAASIILPTSHQEVTPIKFGRFSTIAGQGSEDRIGRGKGEAGAGAESVPHSFGRFRIARTPFERLRYALGMQNFVRPKHGRDERDERRRVRHESGHGKEEGR